jgi:histidyl-tRNA synthetase
MSASTKPASGFRDFLPPEIRRREHVIRVVREVYDAYGFDPLETPAVERLDVLLGKYGDEGDQLMFAVAKRGESLVEGVAGLRPAAGDAGTDLAPAAIRNAVCDGALRYDLTVPLARVVAEHQGKLPRLFKRYQIQTVWRADRPQKGRYREFFQCDVDVVGSSSRTVEVEVCSAVAEVLARLGFADFRIVVNHRGILAGIIEAAGVPAELEGAVFVAIDKLDKVGVDGVLKELAARGVSADSAARLATLLTPVEGGNDAELARLRAFLGGSERGRAGLADLEGFLALAAASPAAARLAVDPSLARGLSYYTGCVFEIRVPDLSGSLGGGGRYDGLVGMFLGRDVPACGFSIGLERVLVVMEERGLFPEDAAAADVLVARFDDAESARLALGLASDLRAAGLRVLLHDEPAKLGKQFQDADARGIGVVALVGSDEAGRGAVALKHLRTGEKAEVPRAGAADWIRARR